jgi:hypothetical protein
MANHVHYCSPRDFLCIVRGGPSDGSTDFILFYFILFCTLDLEAPICTVHHPPIIRALEANKRRPDQVQEENAKEI